MESTHSRQQKSIDSTYPLPSLCSSISSSNSTLHDMSTTTNTTFSTSTSSNTNTTTTNNTTNNNNNQLLHHQQPHQRWDESQLALELADDTPVPEHKSLKQSAKHLKHKLLKSFQPTEQDAKSNRYKKWKHLLLKS